MPGGNSDLISSGAGLGAGIGGALGAAGGRIANKPLYDEILRIIQEDSRAFEGLTVPQLERLKAEQLGPSAFEGIQEDGGTIAAQKAALARLASISAQGGMDPMGRAALEQGRQAASGMASGAKQAARSRLAARGMQGSGAMLAAEAGADAGGANRLSATGYDAAAAAQNRGMQAINGTGALAGQMRGQDYKRASDLAAAKDAIAYHNMQSRSDANRYNALLPQAMLENRLKVMNAKSGAHQRLAAYLNGQAQGNIDMTQGVGEGMGGLVGAAGGVAAKVNGVG